MKSRLLASAVLAVLSGLAFFQDTGGVTAAVCVAILLGCGVALCWAVPRRFSRRRIPPAHSLLGAVILGVGITSVMAPEKMFGQFWSIVGSTVTLGTGPGFTYSQDRWPTREDAEQVAVVSGFRTMVAEKFFDPGPQDCHVHIELLKDDKFIQNLPHGTLGDFGRYGNSFLQGATVVALDRSGFGSLTHHLMYHYLGCTYGHGKLAQWVRRGMATLVEKVVVLDDVYSVGYRHPNRFQNGYLSLHQQGLEQILMEGVDQNALQLFFLYLHRKGQLKPLMEKMKTSQLLGIDALEQVTQMGPRGLKEEVKKWLATEARTIPLLDYSVAERGPRAQQMKMKLSQHMRWDEAWEIWVPNSGQADYTFTVD